MGMGRGGSGPPGCRLTSAAVEQRGLSVSYRASEKPSLLQKARSWLVGTSWEERALPPQLTRAPVSSPWLEPALLSLHAGSSLREDQRLQVTLPTTPV